MKRYCVRVCLFAGLMDINELVTLLECIRSAGSIGPVWRSDGSVFVDLNAPADCNDRNSIHWCAGFVERMREYGFNAVAAPCQL